MIDTAVQPEPVVSRLEDGETFPPPAPRHSFLIRHRIWILLALTFLGGAMRFSLLDRPPLWGDEAFTFARVCGNFRQMLDALVYDGFPPLHYEAYWALGQATPLTPRIMRLIPATAGTLMIPVMYFLAAQIVRKQTALLTAAFTAFSAYMMVYSRDAKMYMACWMFMSLNVGCLLWWLRSNRRIAWLAWIAAGLAMVGMQLSTLAVMAVEPVMLLTIVFSKKPRRGGWRFVALFLIGLILIGSSAAGYKLGFNRWDQQVTELGFASGSGIGWVEQYNKGRTGPDLILSATTAHLLSWEWPLKSTHFADLGIDPRVEHQLKGWSVGILLLMAIGAVSGRYIFRRSAMEVRNAQAARWSSLWLCLWIMLPAYAMYCVSVREFASPLDWIHTCATYLGQAGPLTIWCAVSGFVFLAVLGVRWDKLAAASIILLFVAAVVWQVVVIILNHRAGGHTDVWAHLTRWLEGVCQPRSVVITLSLLGLIAWQSGALNLADRWKNLGWTATIALALFAGCWIVFAGVTYHFNSLVADMTADHHMAPQWEMLTQRAARDHGIPTLETATKQVSESSKEQTAARAHDLIVTRQFHWNHLLAAAKNERAAAERIASESVIWDRWVSVWMPRYVGMCWPALAIAACALLLRLPTWPLRSAAIAMLCTVNVIQLGARIFTPTEPPLPLVFADIAAGQAASTRTYLNHMNPPNMGHPGMLGVFGMAGRYYLTQVAGKPITPEQFYSFDSFFPRDRVAWGAWKFTFQLDESPAHIADEIHRSPEVRRAIIWEPVNDRDGSGTIGESLAKLLGDGWKLTSEERFVGRYHWTWEKLYTIRRQEWDRVP